MIRLSPAVLIPCRDVTELMPSRQIAGRAAVLESLRQENLRLRTQLSASEQQVQSLAQRIEQASSRLDTLLKQSHHG